MIEHQERCWQSGATLSIDDPLATPMHAEARMYYFLKDRLPKGWSFPLGRGVLDAALESAGVTSVAFVRYRLHGGSLRGEQYRWPLRVEFGREEPGSIASAR